jgi:phosphoglycerate dehydrogenase-like enzyme
MKRYKVVYTTERGEFHQQRALSAAPEYLDITMLRHPDRADLLAHLATAEYLISERVGVIDAPMIQAAPHLKLILRLGSLNYDIDSEAAKRAGLVVCRWPDRGVIYVAEHVVLQLLALAKNLHDAESIALEAAPHWRESKRTDENTFAYNWSSRRNIHGLWQKTVGILGFGEIGAELARRLQSWGCAVCYPKRSRLPQAVETELGITYADQDTLLRQSDYLVNLLPYFPNTAQTLNAACFDVMKPGAYLVSCGSGGVIDEAALAAAIQSGKLAGAALDTYDWEPIRPDNPLIALAKQGYNIVLTPHIAAGGHSANADDQGRADDYTNIVHHIEGKPLLYRVD